MVFFRLLVNSVAAACFATTFVLTVVLQLNPALQIDTPHLMRLAVNPGVVYAVHFMVLFYALLVARQLFARDVFAPAWLSVGVLAWLGALTAAGGAALMGANSYTFARVLDEATVVGMTQGAAALGVACLLFLLLLLARRAWGPGLRWLWAPLLVVIATGAVATPLMLRGSGTVPLLDARPLDTGIDFMASERSPHVTVIAVDAASLDFIARATAEGRLPNFGRILDAGAVMHLATIHPTSAEAVWAAVATGKLPLKNGVRSSGIYHLATGGDPLELLPDYCFANQLVRFGFLFEEPHTSATLRARALWSILSTHGLSVGTVGWPLTQPAPVVRGYVVADSYLRLADTPMGIVDSPAVFPGDIQTEVARAAARAMADAPAVPREARALEQGHQGPGRTDRAYDRIARDLAEERSPQVTLTRYQSLDTIGHYFLRYALPLEFGDVADEEHRALGDVLERHYRLVDDAIGRAIHALGPEDLLLVVSGYGMEPMGLARRLVERVIGDADLNGTHDSAPDGFLMAYGASVARGRSLPRASVVDVTPTILYFLGLPVARDMDGYARADLFQRAFTDERPITFIPTYDR